VGVRATCGDGIVEVEVADDGVGGATMGDGSGLTGLAQPIEALGGSFQIDSAPGEGTKVRATIPVAAGNAETDSL
jgi:signal transduction histidine kinase